MVENIITDFPITLYGNLEKYSDTISKGRCRIFYKGGNRNGTFITDEFAEKLLATIPYTPVKGIYESDDEDYTDHGSKRSEGRIYGIVPATPNLSWEKHLDEDGEERVYACVDVLIYTALYSEAHEIFGKGQSMELYSPSIKGDWKIINGRKYYVFSEGSFLGLQVLGDSTEPCFEGAAFFSLYEDLKKMVQHIEYHLSQHNGGEKMLNYKISDSAKFNAIWSLLNTNWNEEGNWTVEFDICEIYDEYAVVRNHAEGIFERVYYTKDNETDTVELGERERCYFVDVTESEKAALENLHTANNNTYDKVDENYATALAEVGAKEEALNEKSQAYDELAEKFSAETSNYETKIGELNERISTLEVEKDGYVSSLAEAKIEAANLNEQIATLNSFKAEVEKNEKNAIIAKYEKLLSAELLDSYSARLGEYSNAKALDKDLAYELVSNNQSVFTANGNPQPAYVPRDVDTGSGLEGILNKYQK